MYSNRQVEEKRFWASSLTFGDFHALIAKAEHSRQVLHDTLEDQSYKREICVRRCGEPRRKSHK